MVSLESCWAVRYCGAVYFSILPSLQFWEIYQFWAVRSERVKGGSITESWKYFQRGEPDLVFGVDLLISTLLLTTVSGNRWMAAELIIFCNFSPPSFPESLLFPHYEARTLGTTLTFLVFLAKTCHNKWWFGRILCFVVPESVKLIKAVWKAKWSFKNSTKGFDYYAWRLE